MSLVSETAVNEEVLIAKAREGDIHSFSALVRKHQERAVHIAYSILGNMEDARDVAQEAFVKAYQGLKGFKGKSQFSTWLYRILMNLCKDQLRKKKVLKYLSFFKPGTEGEELDLSEAIPAQGSGPLGELLDQELDKAIHRNIEALPMSQKTVFTLRYLEGMSLYEIAETLGLSLGAVKANLWQAGQKMKKNLSSYRLEGGLNHERRII